MSAQRQLIEEPASCRTPYVLWLHSTSSLVQSVHPAAYALQPSLPEHPCLYMSGLRLARNVLTVPLSSHNTLSVVNYYAILQVILTYAHGEAEKHCRKTGLFPEAFSGATSSHRTLSYVLVDFLRI